MTGWMRPGRAGFWLAAVAATLVLAWLLVPWLLPRGEEPAASGPSFCHEADLEGAPFLTCTVDLEQFSLRLEHADAAGKSFGSFEALAAWMQAQGQNLVLAMNAGMYHADRSPVGLFRQEGREFHGLSLKDGPGNFHMKPNGVFYLRANRAAVLESEAYALAAPAPDHATQSGPMLVIDGKLHPKFQENSTSRHVRNGVCATAAGRLVHLVISRRAVNFHHFARFFRDRLHCRDALYLDGFVSSLWSPGDGIRIDGHPLGPMIAVGTPVEEGR